MNDGRTVSCVCCYRLLQGSVPALGVPTLSRLVPSSPALSVYMPFPERHPEGITQQTAFTHGLLLPVLSLRRCTMQIRLPRHPQTPSCCPFAVPAHTQLRQHPCCSARPASPRTPSSWVTLCVAS